MPKNKDLFKNKNFNLSVFLYVKGFQLVDIENHSERKSFIFEDSPELQKMVQVFNFGKTNEPELMMDARKIFKGIREMKDKLYTSEN